MRKAWPKATIRELFTLADATGQAAATLTSEREAKLFRFAIYNFRRAEGIGNDIFVGLESSTVTLVKREMPSIVIAQEERRV